MATITLHDDHVLISVGIGEKIAGLFGDQRIPLADIRSATVEPGPLRALNGMRAPGLSVPGRTKIGTWRGHDRTLFVCLHSSAPALRIETTSTNRYDGYIVSVDAPQTLANRITEAARRHRS